MTPKSSPKKPSSKRTVSVSQAIVLSALSASVGVVSTALVFAHFLVGSNYYIDSSIFSISSISSTRYASTSTIHHPGDLLSASSRPAKSIQPLLAPPAAVDATGPWPKVVWLMSFPNSGTSYTLHLVREATNTTTATNYALEGDIKDTPSIPIHASAPQGPFLQLCKDRQTTLPTTHILTKTHCNAFCSDCLPKNYIETPRSFEVSCRSGTKAVADQTGYLYKQAVTYDQALVTKAVHMFRHPLDNVVARYHLEYNTLRKKEAGWEKSHPNNRTGFAAWCNEMDATSQLGRMRWIDPHLMTLLMKIPCHQEFYRYIQWHNLAFDVTRGKGVSVHVVHYHDYSENFDETLSKLLGFLELSHNGKVEPFHAGKVYNDYYTQKERQNIRHVIRELASVDTWENVKDYEF